MELSPFERQLWTNFAVSLLSPLFMTLFFLQGMRAYVSGLYMTVWNIVWIPGSPVLPLLTVFVFCFPIFALIVAKKVTSKNLAVGSIICVSIFSFMLGFNFSYGLEILLSSLVVGFYSIFFPFYLYCKFGDNPAERSKIDLVLFVCGFALALSFDLFVRTLGVTYGPGFNLALLPLQFVFVMTGIALGALLYQESLSQENVGHEAQFASRIGGILVPSGIGALFFLEFAILANPNSILRLAQSGYTIVDLAIFTPILILTVSLAALVLAIPDFRYTIERWQTILVGNLMIFVGIFSLLFMRTWASAVILLVAQFFVPFILYAMLRYVLLHRFKWRKKVILASSFFLGLLILLLWDFMYAFSFVHAFLGPIGNIFEGQIPTILLLAVTILGITSTFGALKTDGERRK